MLVLLFVSFYCDGPCENSMYFGSKNIIMKGLIVISTPSRILSLRFIHFFKFTEEVHSSKGQYHVRTFRTPNLAKNWTTCW